MFKKSQPGCACCEAETCNINCVAACVDGLAPDEWLVEFTGITDAGSCTGCSAMNTSFTVARNAECSWRLILGGGGMQACTSCFTATQRIVEVSGSLSGSNYLITVTVRVTGPPTGGDVINFSKNFGTTRPSCCELIGVDIPYLNEFPASFCPCCSCTYSAATCTLTAIV